LIEVEVIDVVVIDDVGELSGWVCKDLVRFEGMRWILGHRLLAVWLAFILNCCLRILD
jgi:hypothetical protein